MSHNKIDRKMKKKSANTRPQRLRIVIAGSENTGKSCIIKRYCEKRFVSKYISTVGIDYGSTRIFADKREISVHIFDTSGSSIYADIRNEFYRDAHGIMLVFDVSNRDSFDELSHWVKEIAFELAKDGQTLDNTVILVCANKTDLKKERSVDELEARLWADIRGFGYMESSACSGEGIADLFQTFFTSILKVVSNGTKTSKTTDRKRSSKPIPSLTPSNDQLLVIDRLKHGCNPYVQMGLDPSRRITLEEVNKTYRKLAVLLHPDKTDVEGADEAFKILGTARKAIINSFKG